MRKTVLHVLALIIAVLLLVQAHCGRREAVAQARAAASHLRLQRDSLVTVVRQREKEQAALTVRLQQHREEANGLRDSVTAIERRRSALQLDVRQLRTVGALQGRLRTTFPELGDAAWGVTTLALDDRDTLGLEYLMVPAWFAETFVIDHANAESWREQKDRLLAVDSLRLAVTTLQDSVLRLEAANADAYRTGYDAASASYQDLSRRHIAVLQKPRITLPSIVSFVGAAGVGLVVGRVLR